MIKVPRADEPAWFKEKVEEPGEKWRKAQAAPIDSKTWGKGAFWNKVPAVQDELFAAYGHCCVYTARRVMGEGRSVDHVRPKSKHPELAFKWDNYLPMLKNFNSTKNDHEDVLDPRRIGYDWFELSIPSMLTKPGSSGGSIDAATPESTIQRLKLNTNRHHRPALAIILFEFLDNGDWSFVRKMTPFLAQQLTMQNFVTGNGVLTAKGEKLKAALAGQKETEKLWKKVKL